MNKTQLKQVWLQEEKASIEGWNFSHLKGRWINEQLVWDYEKILRKYLKTTDYLLDMGTGGGEFLLSLQHPLSQCSVTEGYKPNFILCKERLAPLGVKVEEIVDDSHIPYENESFDIVINRHTPYDLNEVHRVLKPNGIFITQQVGIQNSEDLTEKMHLNREEVSVFTKDLKAAMKYAKQANFNVKEAYESFTPMYFLDVGAFVYYAHIISWEFVNFDVNRNADDLYKLQEELEKFGRIEGKEHRYLMVLKK